MMKMMMVMIVTKKTDDILVIMKNYYIFLLQPDGHIEHVSGWSTDATRNSPDISCGG